MPRFRLSHRLVLILTFALALSACSARVPVALSPEPAPGLPAYAAPCLDADATAQTCENAAITSARLGDRATAGQMLIAHAGGAARRVALWLNPALWAPAPVAAEIPAGTEVPDPEVVGGAVLLFADTVSEPGDGVVVPLSIPPGRGWMAGAGLATVAAAAVGADAAVFREGGRDVAVPAAPLAGLLLGAPLSGPPEALDAFRLIASADRALSAGDFPTAAARLEDAAERLPADAAACALVGALASLRASVATWANDSQTDLITQLDDVCVKATDVDDPLSQEYLRVSRFFDENLGADASSMPRQWLDAESRHSYAAEVEALADRLGDRRGELLRLQVRTMLARTMEPVDRCDDIEPRQTAALREVNDAYLSQGRPDLALASLTGVIDSEGHVRADRVEQVLKWSQAPENRWIKTAGLRSALHSALLAHQQIGAGIAVDSLCNASYDAIEADIDGDDLAGNSERNVGRLFSMIGSVPTCHRVQRSDELADKILTKALASEDKADVLMVLVYSGFEVLTRLVGGQGQDAIMGAQTLRRGMDRVSAQRGESSEERVLWATVDVLSALIDRLVGGPKDLAETLRAGIAVTASVESEEQPSTLVQLAPGLHLAALSLLATEQAIDGDASGMEGTLKQLHDSLSGDIIALLTAYGVPEHGDAVTRIAEATLDTIGALGSDAKVAPKSLLASAQQAAKPSSVEHRWWAIGLGVSRVALLDAAAYVASEAGDAPTTSAAMDAARRSLAVTVERILNDFEGRETGWEVLHLLAPVHEVTLTLILSGDEEDDVATRAALKAGLDSLNAGFDRISPRVKDAKPEDVGFLAVILDAIAGARAVGFDALVSGAPGSAERWMAKMNQGAEGYPPEFRFVLDIAASFILSRDGMTGAQKALDRATDRAEGSYLKNVAYLPRLLEARLLDRAGDKKAALAVVDDVLKASEPSLACGRSHEVLGLLQYRARTLESLGRHREADADLGRILTLADRGMAADGMVACTFTSIRPEFTFNINVGDRVGAILLAGTQDGTFQVGGGFQTESRDFERISCTGAPLAAPRLDLVLNAQLARAAYAMRADDSAGALDALTAAISLARLIRNAQPVAVDPGLMSRIEDARTKTDVALVLWVSFLARARGYLAPSDKLDEFARLLSGLQDEALKTLLAGDMKVPAVLEGLGFEPLGPAVRTYWSARDAEAIPGFRKEVLAASKVPGVPASATPLLVTMVTARIEGRDAALKQLARMRLRDPRAKLVQRQLAFFLQTQADKQPPVAEVSALASDLVAVGDYQDSAGLLIALFLARTQSGDTSGAVELLAKGLDLIPADKAPEVRADLLLAGASLMTDTAMVRWSRAVGEVVGALEARVPVQTELQLLNIGFMRAWNDGRYGLMESMVERMVQVLSRAVGPDDSDLLQLSITLVALQTHRGHLDVERWHSLATALSAAKELHPSFKHFIDALIAHSSDVDGCKDIASTFLESGRSHSR